MNRAFRAAPIAGCALLMVSVAYGQSDPQLIDRAYPAKAVRLVVPFGPGSGADIIGRLIAQKLSERWQQAVVIDNRAGASGNIAAELVAKSASDGYILLLGNIATHGINPALYGKKLAYDALADFAPVTLLAKAPDVLVVHPSLPVKTVSELIALARAKPGKLNFGSSGTGSGGHMPAELLKSATGIDIVHVPYKGSGQSLTALLSGEVAIVFTGTLSVLAHIRSGRMRALAVSSDKRTTVLPEVPTMAEAGVTGYEADLWFGVLAPAKTPNTIVAALNAAANAALGAPDIKARLLEQGAEIAGGTPDQFAAFSKAEIAKWTTVIKVAGIRAD